MRGISRETRSKSVDGMFQVLQMFERVQTWQRITGCWYSRVEWFEFNAASGFAVVRGRRWWLRNNPTLQRSHPSQVISGAQTLNGHPAVGIPRFQLSADLPSSRQDLLSTPTIPQLASCGSAQDWLSRFSRKHGDE